LSTLVIIPARSGSKGVLNKNIKNVRGVPLLAWSIKAGMKLNVDEVFVSTDSFQYADIALQYGASVPFLRPAQLACDNSSDTEFIEHALTNYAKLGRKFDYVIHLRPTTPARDLTILKEAYEMMVSYKYKYIRSAHECSESPLKWFIEEAGYAQPLHSSVARMEDNNLPRQAFQTVYVPNGYIDIINARHFIEHNDLYLNNVKIFKTPFTQEIDNFDDMKITELRATTIDSDIYENLE
jgi:CMP-N,N'-diacetyllegionaminic acid synthase